MAHINKILLVDDDNVTNILHKRVIERSNCVENVLVATDGVDALEILENHVANDEPLPELIFLDINMPRMDGFEFLEQYQARGLGNDKNKIVIMLSTSLLESDHERAAADPNVHSFEAKMIRADMFKKLLNDLFSGEKDEAPRLN